MPRSDGLGRAARGGAICALVVLLLLSASPGLPVTLRETGSPAPAASSHVRPMGIVSHLNVTTVGFDLSSSLNATIGVALNFETTFGLTSATLDAGTSTTGRVALLANPNATLQVSSLGYTQGLPIPTLGTYGPVTLPGLTYTYLGIQLNLALVTQASVNGTLALGLPGSMGSPVNETWTAPGDANFTVAAPAGSGGQSFDVELTHLNYVLSAGVDAQGSVPLLGPVTIPVIPMTPLGTVPGSPATLSSAYPIVPPPTITGFTARPASLSVGTLTNLSATVTGGNPPVSFDYAGLPPGCPSADSASILCTPTSAGSYRVTVTATDAQGLNSSSVLTLTVASAPGPNRAGGGSDLAAYELPLGIALAAAAVAAAFLLGRRGRRSPPAPLRPAEAPPGGS